MANSDPTKRPRPGPWPPAPDSTAMPPPSWAKKTGFRPKFSGETNASDSGQIVVPPKPKEPDSNVDLELGRVRPPPAAPAAPAVPAAPVANGVPEGEKVPVPSEKTQTVKKRRNSDGAPVPKSSALGPNGQAPAAPAEPQPRRPARSEEAVDVLPQTVDDDGFVARHSHMKYELRDTPGLGEFHVVMLDYLMFLE